MLLWASVGTGRRSRLKIVWPYGRVGSSPTSPTSIKLSGILPTDFAAQSAASLIGQIPESQILVRLYDEKEPILNETDGVSYRTDCQVSWRNSKKFNQIIQNYGNQPRGTKFRNNPHPRSYS